jgi:hypothetical protein
MANQSRSSLKNDRKSDKFLVLVKNNGLVFGSLKNKLNCPFFLSFFRSNIPAE